VAELKPGASNEIKTDLNAQNRLNSLKMVNKSKVA
jgi:hypothetical protein